MPPATRLAYMLAERYIQRHGPCLCRMRFHHGAVFHDSPWYIDLTEHQEAPHLAAQHTGLN